ncbi:MAG: DEAD/DEAH box helicase family protein [Opitutae bacterium]|nr:DEAD/DEAH box helicase family protein [Opitutae bacterium]MBT6461501.1 DEAD/DEAH box helicase family protein [Opitutae bacterium]MBT7854678.1 DEAD/DEAH box helicase family protein [Opitutae bacterium]
MSDSFPNIRFKGELRPSQEDVVQIARQQLKSGFKKIHVVAPPGSGKTVTGLFLWAEVIRKPALVLSPNTAIQSQWSARTDLFSVDGASLPHEWISADPDKPSLLTSLTYQSVTLPSRGDEALDEMAIHDWIDVLIEKEQALDPAEARVWIDDLEVHNPGYYKKRLGFYRKKKRDEIAQEGDLGKLLHASSRSALRSLRELNVGLIILDECHHLLGHWGRVLSAAQEYLGDPIVVGLTATPPGDGHKDTADARRYREYFGPIVYEVPVPAVVKDGFLAPYQDLAYFVRPNTGELHFVAQASDALDALIKDLTNPPVDKDGIPIREGLADYAHRILSGLELPTRKADSWQDFDNWAPAFSSAARFFLLDQGRFLPTGVPSPSEIEELIVHPTLTNPLDRFIPLVSWYIRHALRGSSCSKDHELAERAITRLRMLGLQITETGHQVCASPVARVLAYSRAKAQALIPILKKEQEALGDTIRAVVICDYEKTAAVSGEISHLLDKEAGGAIAAFRELLNDEETDALDPVLLTGSTVLVDDDLKPRLEGAAIEWLQQNHKSVDFEWAEESGFFVLMGKGADWCPRVYVEMLTDLFQRGITRCLVGTRGLLGEGWDANKINVLIDLSCVTTSMSVNQLRGRSFRLDPDAPWKLANNWDVVCIAPEFAKGMDDYIRFRRKHTRLFGVTDDGAIEKGVGHVHAAFTEMKIEGVEDNMVDLNRDMLKRVSQREHFRILWKIGQPYHPEPIKAVEIKGKKGMGRGFPPMRSMGSEWTEGTLTQAIGRSIIFSLYEVGLLKGLSATELVRRFIVAERAGGYIRAFMEEVDEDTSRLFAEALSEVFGPLTKARYVIQRSVDFKYHESWFSNTWAERILPGRISSFIVRKTLKEKRRREVIKIHAVPRELARNKERALIFQGFWNRFVSPGNVMFHRQDGTQEILASATRDGLLPTETIHVKDVFI